MADQTFRSGPRGSVLRPVVVAVLVVLLGACGAGGGTPGATRTPTSYPTGTSTGASPTEDPTDGAAASATDSATEAPTTEPTSQAPPAKKKNLIEWVLGLGVNAPSGPDNKYSPYEALVRRSCDTGAATPVLDAALAACLAAQGGGDPTERWAYAQRVHDETDPRALDCMDVVAYALLDQLLAAHRESPDLPFEFVTADGGGRPSCLGVTGVSPAKAASGDEVTVTGRHLDLATGVRMVYSDATEGLAAELVSAEPGTLTFRVPEGLTDSGFNIIIGWRYRNGPSGTWAPLEFHPTSTDPSTDASGDSAGG